MQPTRFISMLLFIASAIIIGLTSGLIVGMTDANQAAQTPPTSKPESAATQPLTKNQAVSTVSTAQPPAPDTNESTTADSERAYSPRDLTGADLAQVEGMLKDLGYTTSGGITPAVQKYQEDNSLNATGALDIDTLDSMVSKLKVNRIKQLTENKTS